MLNGITNIIIQKYISGGKLKPYCFHNDNYKMQSSTGSSWLVPLRLEGGNPHVRLSEGSHFLFSKWGKKTCLLRHQEKARHEETYICRAQIKFSVLKVFFTEEFCDKHDLSFLSVANCGNLSCVGCTGSSLLHACSLWLQGLLIAVASPVAELGL